MKKSSFARLVFLLLAVFVVMPFTGCASDSSDNAREENKKGDDVKVTGESKASDDAKVTGEPKVSDDAKATGGTEKPDSDENKISAKSKAFLESLPVERRGIPAAKMYEMGTEIMDSDTYSYMGNTIENAFALTVTGAKLYKNIKEAGISEKDICLRDDFERGDFVGKNGKFKPSVRFMVVNMTQENLKAKSKDLNITRRRLFYAVNENETSDGKTLDFCEYAYMNTCIHYPDYFSHPTGKRQEDGSWDGYWQYSIPLKQKKDLKIGWYIDTDVYDTSKFYLAICDYDEDNVKYVHLDFE